MYWKVGSGTRILFREDIWVGDRSLKEYYPRLYANSNKKEQTISECREWDNDKWEWNLAWRREWFEWERPQIEMFSEDIHKITLTRERKDCWMWNDGEDKVYTIKSAYQKLQEASEADQQNFFDYLWRVKVIPYAKFFMWRVILNGIPTNVNLRLRGVNLNNDNCAMCGEHEESISHLFITYRVATKVWNMCNR